jgi:hypothetical protein
VSSCSARSLRRPSPVARNCIVLDGGEVPIVFLPSPYEYVGVTTRRADWRLLPTRARFAEPTTWWRISMPPGGATTSILCLAAFSSGSAVDSTHVPLRISLFPVSVTVVELRRVCHVQCPSCIRSMLFLVTAFAACVLIEGCSTVRYIGCLRCIPRHLQFRAWLRTVSTTPSIGRSHRVFVAPCDYNTRFISS